jgi:hypothetical protein
MKQILFSLLILSCLAQTFAYGQFKASHPVISERQIPAAEASSSQVQKEPEPITDLVLQRLVAALKRLEADVLVHRSLGDFEADGRLARVSIEVFRNDLQEVSAELESIICRLPQSKLKSAITNAMASYRDGEFWWRKIHEPRTVSVYAIGLAETTRTQSQAVFVSSIPYTVAIHWRQAAEYLKRAGDLLDQKD